MEAQLEGPTELTDLNPRWSSDSDCLDQDRLFPGVTVAESDTLQSSTVRLADRPGNPNVWQQRLHLVEALDSDFEKELDLVVELDEIDTIYYWKYRQSILKKIGTTASGKELVYTAKIISKNAKNYYAWSHRQWILKVLEGNKNWQKFEEELYYCDKILRKDVCNAFAWNQRLFVVRCAEGRRGVLKDWETMYAIHAINSQPDNEYPWMYLQRLYDDDDMAPLGYPHYDYVEVLREELFRVEALSTSIAPKYGALNKNDAPSKNDAPKSDANIFIMNRRGCVHALNLILELLDRGYEPEPDNDLVAAISRLYPDSSLWLSDRVWSMLQSLDGKAYWRGFLDNSLSVEQNEVSLGRITEIEELVNEASESRTSPEISLITH